ncbi:MAG: cytochrome P450, partial [Deltaproteobacteria bacterium]
VADRAQVDFVEALAAIIPLAVIAEMLGIPREDWQHVFHLSNTLLGAADPEYQQGATLAETAERAQQDFLEYFRRLSHARRREPRDDFITALANAQVDGKPVPEWELLSYYVLLIVAGNETTRNATSGGLLALIENPGELEKLRRDPTLVPAAVEEIVRWVSPVVQFCRTAVEGVEVRGTRVRKGRACYIFYPSANRDEDVFPDPFTFRVDRTPNGALRLRHRRPLLPRREPRPARAAGYLQAPRGAAGPGGARGAGGPHALELRRGDQAHARPLAVAGVARARCRRRRQPLPTRRARETPADGRERVRQRHRSCSAPSRGSRLARREGECPPVAGVR